uniref:Uncharacterized protein n=1 Tax=Arundo donax TaxID=35708 RepID=A0A0A9D1K0_ARUDO
MALVVSVFYFLSSFISLFICNLVVHNSSKLVLLVKLPNLLRVLVTDNILACFWLS